jgi:hypothetical protein
MFYKYEKYIWLLIFFLLITCDLSQVCLTLSVTKLAREANQQLWSVPHDPFHKPEFSSSFTKGRHAYQTSECDNFAFFSPYSFLKDLSTPRVKRNSDFESRVAELEVELSVWKQAHSVALEA